MPGALGFLSLERFCAGSTQSCRLGWGPLTVSLRPRAARRREGKAGMQGLRSVGDAGAVPRGAGPEPLPEGKGRPRGRAVGPKSIYELNRPACMARIPSWEVEGGTAGWTPGKAARRWGPWSGKKAVTHPVTLKQSVPFLSHSPPTQPSASLESLILDVLTQRPALPAQDSAEMPNEAASRNSGSPNVGLCGCRRCHFAAATWWHHV